MKTIIKKIEKAITWLKKKDLQVDKEINKLIKETTEAVESNESK